MVALLVFEIDFKVNLLLLPLTFTIPLFFYSFSSKGKHLFDDRLKQRFDETIQNT